MKIFSGYKYIITCEGAYAFENNILNFIASNDQAIFIWCVPVQDRVIKALYAHLLVFYSLNTSRSVNT